VKRLGDLQLGDRLYEGAGKFLSRAGRLVGVMKDPSQPGQLFLLAVQADNRLTIYRGEENGIHLALARQLPANVFCEFCNIVQAGLTIHDTDEDVEDGGNSPPKTETAGGNSPPTTQKPPPGEAFEASACLVDYP